MLLGCGKCGRTGAVAEYHSSKSREQIQREEDEYSEYGGSEYESDDEQASATETWHPDNITTSSGGRLTVRPET